MNGFECLDCGIDTADSHEYYMVKDRLWRKANPKMDGMLCITCLESRLGRVLTYKDFTRAPVNDLGGWAQSATLMERLQR